MPILPSKGHLAMCGDMFIVMTQGGLLAPSGIDEGCF